MSDQQVKTLGDAMQEAASELDNRPESGTEVDKPAKAEKRGVSALKTTAEQVREDAPTADDVKKWEAPGWTKMWKEQSRKALEAFASSGNEEHLRALTGELDQTYNYIGQRNQEFALLNKRFGPVSELLTQAEQGFTMQGQSLQQGLQQMFAVSQSLANNPDQTLPWLAERYKPRDPASVLQMLSQVWGADLGQVAQSAPYIDPTVQGLVGPIINRLQSVEQAAWEQNQYFQRQQQEAVVNEIAAFEHATDESGNAKNPYFRDVYDDMVLLCQMGRAKTVQQAYDMATKFNPVAHESKAKQAEQQALALAARNTAATKQASDASKNINGSARGSRDAGNPNIMEAMKLADKQLGL